MFILAGIPRELRYKGDLLPLIVPNCATDMALRDDLLILMIPFISRLGHRAQKYQNELPRFLKRILAARVVVFLR
jgi:hypothetical protein